MIWETTDAEEWINKPDYIPPSSPF